MCFVAGTLATLFVHGSQERPEPDLPMEADAGGSVTSDVSTQVTAFVDVRVLPMTGVGVLPNQTVLVEHGVVTEVGAAGAVNVPAEARVIEGDGRLLMPGLTDAHVHLPDAREDVLALFLANGVTTVFNLQGDPRHIALRERIRSGEVAGPNIVTAGPFLTELNVRSVADAHRVVEEHLSEGYDLLKIHGRIPEAAYIALVDAGRSAGMPVVGHAPRNLPFDAVLEHGQQGVVHAEELIYTHLADLNAERLPELARRIAQADVWVTPTMTTFQAISEQWARPAGLEARLSRPEAAWLPPSLKREWSTSTTYSARRERGRVRIEAMNTFHDPIVSALAAAGVPLLAGTDAPIPGLVPGFSLHDELEELVGAGLSVEEALRTATVNAGAFSVEVLGAPDAFGTVEPGVRADLILVAGDPRAELTLLRQPLGVMASGRWYARAELDELLARSADRPIADR